MTKHAPDAQETGPARLGDRLTDLAIPLLLGLGRALPYRWRVPLMGRIMAHVVAPLAGYTRRVRENLGYVLPELPAAEVARLVRDVPDNVGRCLAEVYSGREFIARVRDTAITGPGAAALAEARAQGRPAVLVTGHFGNYDVARGVLSAQGYPLGGLYKPMKNPRFNAHYVRALSVIGTPLFARGPRGLAEMVRHLRRGGMLGIVMDQHMSHGLPLRFFGKEAMTATSAADMALKYDALLIPIYGIRQPDGLSFAIHVDPPIARGTPAEMTQALNDSLEAQVRAHMAQWFWIHRRWKGADGKKGWARKLAGED